MQIFLLKELYTIVSFYLSTLALSTEFLRYFYWFPFKTYQFITEPLKTNHIHNRTVHNRQRS